MAHSPGPYGKLARFVLHNRAAVGVVVGILVAISLVLGLPPKVDPNLLELLPEEEPAVRALRALNDAEGGVSLMTLVFESEDPELLDRTLTSIQADLEGLDRIEYALYDLPDDLTQQLGLLQLEAAEIDKLNGRLKGALALGPAMNPFVAQQLMAMGPLTQRIEDLAKSPDLLRGGNGRARILARPSDSSHNQPFAVAVMEDVDAVLAKHAVEGVELVWFGGAYRHSVEDFKGIQSDLLSTTGTSFGLVLCVMLVAFRSWRGLVLVFVPLLAANAMVMAIVWLVMDSLNTYTSFGTAILIGLGIDFAVHLVGRYREYRARGKDIETSLMRAWDRTGPPCMTAALTSAAGFLALAAADFQGFAQLGVLLAVGLMLCLIMMLVLLPALIPTLDKSTTPLLGVTAPRNTVSTSSYRGAPVLLSIAILLTGVVGVRAIPHLEWEFDFSALRRSGMAYSELTEAERQNAKDSYSPLVVTPGPGQLAAVQDKLEAAIDSGALKHVKRVVSIRTLLPDDQALRVKSLQTLVELTEHPNLKYLPPPLVAQLQPLQGAEPRMRSSEDLPLPLRDLLGARDGANPRLLVFPTGNMWDLRETSALEIEIHELLEPGTVAGDYVALGALYRVVNRDMPLVAGLALVMVLVLTIIDLRRLHWVAAAMGTLIAGMVWAAWAIEAVGVKLSMMNVVGVPILVGIGVDVVIHLLHRLRDEGPGGVRRALRTTGVAASISTATTIASFASLTVAGNRGVQSMGLLVVFGLLAVFTATCVLLPLAWAAGFRVTGRAPSLSRIPDTQTSEADEE